ncbi:hypothetical protein IWQ60_001436 [Tieghemiomyces parasiticus]|uniref:PhoD-like phosphatase domain-containing protein n=1 Tax=Tieghemiomyces parasiticus TaxID=78921 RepID=A0A9W8AEM3_9FUNG|nr:hypothetical protein IWQ60_001436 [Tieghemiomyces parasiticus]
MYPYPNNNRPNSYTPSEGSSGYPPSNSGGPGYPSGGPNHGQHGNSGGSGYPSGGPNHGHNSSGGYGYPPDVSPFPNPPAMYPPSAGPGFHAPYPPPTGNYPPPSSISMPGGNGSGAYPPPMHSPGSGAYGNSYPAPPPPPPARPDLPPRIQSIGYPDPYSQGPGAPYPPAAGPQRPPPPPRPTITTSTTSYPNRPNQSTAQAGPMSANPMYQPSHQSFGASSPGYPVPGGMAQNTPNAPVNVIPVYQPGQPRFDPDGIDGFHGPLLRFGDMNFHTRVFSGSVLVISTRGNLARAPMLTIVDQGVVVDQIEGQAIDQLGNHTFWRFGFRLQLTDNERPIQYSINQGRQHRFVLPSATRSWRWMFYSCNGFSASIKDPMGEFNGANPLWDDFLGKHERMPYHVMVGGGDQLYCDAVWTLPELKPFLDCKDKKKRKQVTFTPEMQYAVEQFYFNHYTYVFLYESSFRHAVSSVPYAMMIDDHDIFDGYGSYPDYLQQSHVFKGVGAVALRFYMLFQQQSTVQLAAKHQLFGASSFSWLKHLGSSTAVLGVDARFERSLTQVVSPASYDIIFGKLRDHLSTECRHLVVVLGVPIAYPRMSTAETALTVLSSTTVGSLLVKSGAVSGTLNEFGEPELLDDLNDHWTAKIHDTERNELVSRLQKFAQTRSIRVTFLSGDVHCCAVGKFMSKPSRKSGSAGATLAHTKDHRLMYQVVSSAIVNAPPPLALLRTLHVTSSNNTFDKYTDERMIDFFERDVDNTNLTNRKMLGRRNYCTVAEDGPSGDLVFVIHAETLDHRSTVPYQLNVPVLMPSTGDYH